MQGTIKKNKYVSAKTLAKVGILSAVAYVLMFISVPLPIFPSFLKLDVSDIPAIFGGMAMGPLAGFIIALIKNLLQIGATFTGGVGEIANAIIGGTYVVIISYVYKRRNDLKGVIMGALLAILGMTIMGCLANYFVVTPIYGQVFGSLDAIIAMGSAINPKIHDLFTFVIWVYAPFNIIKASIMTLCILPLYKKMNKLLKK
ncbi:MULTISPECIES: ECF transporter S component [unclassified Romboutsia]|uniref:ECF transporter S component n=1 Tax=unclassified Romboutsia TaxID=2626894 RepID=UPI0008215FC7|nr:MULTISPECIES: ECF transporter S component [unclassified Romboutsia]SCI34517.1 Riboflavin ECF transporter S component RibU [uncultured Clostridium sp.]